MTACKWLKKAKVQEYLTELAKEEDRKDKKDREKRKKRYLKELEKIALSNLNNYRPRAIKTSDGEKRVRIFGYEGEDPETCSPAALKEISFNRYGSVLKTHNKVKALIKLIEREDGIDERINKKQEEEKNTIENDGFVEALEGVAEKVCGEDEEE